MYSYVVLKILKYSSNRFLFSFFFFLYFLSAIGSVVEGLDIMVFGTVV